MKLSDIKQGQTVLLPVKVLSVDAGGYDPYPVKIQIPRHHDGETGAGRVWLHEDVLAQLQPDGPRANVDDPTGKGAPFG